MLNLLWLTILQINGGTNSKNKALVEIELMSGSQIPLLSCYELHTPSVSLTHIFASVTHSTCAARSAGQLLRSFRAYNPYQQFIREFTGLRSIRKSLHQATRMLQGACEETARDD